MNEDLMAEYIVENEDSIGSRPFALLMAQHVDIQLPAALHPEGIEGSVNVRHLARHVLEKGPIGVTAHDVLGG